jgi:flavodoxin
VIEPSTSGTRVLLAYFSRPGENYNYGGRIDLKVGNTQVLAAMIAEMIMVDVYRVEAAVPYPRDYEQTVARNVQEERDDARPQIAGRLPSLDGYNTILLGSPVWNSQEPMIMRTFTDSYDWTGKTAQPFVTYAVSHIGTVQRDYVRLCKGANVGDGLAVRGETVKSARPEAEAWLRQIGLA